MPKEPVAKYVVKFVCPDCGAAVVLKYDPSRQLYFGSCTDCGEQYRGYPDDEDAAVFRKD